MNISKHLIIFAFSALFFGTEVKAQLKISFGDNPQSVLSTVKYLTNQTNSSQGEVSAYNKVKYENGNPVEIIFVKKNLTNLYGTLTQHFTAKERLIFSNNKLSKKLVEIPEKSLSEVKKAIGKSNQFNFIDDYIFSENYESVYSVFLNSDKIVTVQSLPTNSQKFPAKVQKEIDSIFQKKLDEEKKKQQENELNEPLQKENIKKEESQIYTAIAKKAEFVGGEKELRKYLSENIDLDLNEINKLKEEQGVSRFDVNVNFWIDKEGNVNGIKVISRGQTRSAPYFIQKSIERCFLKMPKWNPAQADDGTSVRSSMTLPLSF